MAINFKKEFKLEDMTQVYKDVIVISRLVISTWWRLCLHHVEKANKLLNILTHVTRDVQKNSIGYILLNVVLP